jgi:hypothetical protein
VVACRSITPFTLSGIGERCTAFDAPDGRLMQDHIQPLGVFSKQIEIRPVGFDRKDLSFGKMSRSFNDLSADIGTGINNDGGFP